LILSSVSRLRREKEKRKLLIDKKLKKRGLLLNLNADNSSMRSKRELKKLKKRLREWKLRIKSRKEFKLDNSHKPK
jgi:hypothetical protein